MIGRERNISATFAQHTFKMALWAAAKMVAIEMREGIYVAESNKSSFRK